MKALFDYIKARIDARYLDEDDEPIFKAVRMWNEQFANANDKETQPAPGKGSYRKGPTERPMRYPCLFVEFQVLEVWNRCMKIKDILVQVRFRIGIESYKFERFDTFDFVDNFGACMQLAAPSSPTMSFTTFRESMTEYDENYSNVEIPTKDYITLFRDLSAYRPLTATKTGIPVDINVEDLPSPEVPVSDGVFDETFDETFD